MNISYFFFFFKLAIKNFPKVSGYHKVQVVCSTLTMKKLGIKSYCKKPIWSLILSHKNVVFLPARKGGEQVKNKARTVSEMVYSQP